MRSPGTLFGRDNFDPMGKRILRLIVLLVCARESEGVHFLIDPPAQAAQAEPLGTWKLYDNAPSLSRPVEKISQTFSLSGHPNMFFVSGMYNTTNSWQVRQSMS